MAWAYECARIRRKGAWRVQTISMPPQAAKGARHDGSLDFVLGGQGRLVARVAQDGLLVAIRALERLIEVELFVLGLLFLPVVCVSFCNEREINNTDFPFTGGTNSSYSPSAPVRTPSKYSRTFLGRVKALACFLSRFVIKSPNRLFLYFPTRLGSRFTEQSQQNQAASSLGSTTGSWSM